MTAIIALISSGSLKTYLELAAAAMLLAVVAWYPHHEREVGKQQLLAQQAAVNAATAVHNQEVEDRAKVLADQSVSQFKATLAAPPAADAPHVRMCQPAANAKLVQNDASAGPVDHAAVPGTAMVEGRDIGPPTDQKFQQLDSQVKALQGYISACQQAGICKQ